jgi:hypothetical protein
MDRESKQALRGTDVAAWRNDEAGVYGIELRYLDPAAQSVMLIVPADAHKVWIEGAGWTGKLLHLDLAVALVLEELHFLHVPHVKIDTGIVAKNMIRLIAFTGRTTLETPWRTYEFSDIDVKATEVIYLGAPEISAPYTAAE